MKFYLRKHETDKGTLIAVCDAEILGQRFEQGDKILLISERFFGGDLVDVEGVRSSLKNFDSANIVGNRIVEELLKISLIDASGVKEIGGVKYAYIFKI